VERSTFSALLLACIAFTIAIAGCGGTGDKELPVTITLSPSAATVQPGATLQLTATVANDSAAKGVTWMVSCSAPPCGTVSPTATASGSATTYTAPLSSPASTLTVAVTATSVAASSKSASATITVPGAGGSGIAVSISPTPASVAVGTTVQFTATVTGDSSAHGVTWAVACASPSCGSISPTATASGTPTTYTAPTTIPTGNLDVSITATSVTDTAVLAVVNFVVPGTTVSIDSQSTSEVLAGGTAQIVASVANDPNNKGVTWSVSCDPSPCGTVSPTATASGAATTYTAPATPPANDLPVTITATSVFNTGASNTAGIVVDAVKTSLTPDSALIPEGVTQTFTASVANDPSNRGVTWTLTQNGTACAPACGTIAPSSTASGVGATYTAPATVPASPTVSLTAVSVEDTTKFALATLTLTAGQVKLVPARLFFSASVGATSTPQPTALTNTGSSSLSITSITPSATFAQTNNCGTSVAAGTSCTINITFHPTVDGTVNGNLTIVDSSADGQQVVTLSGRGFALCRVQIKETLSSPIARSALSTFGTAFAPKPSGPSQVGTRVMRLVDSTRDDPFLENGSKRELMVRFWYPASLRQAACKAAEYTPPAVWSYFSQLMGIPLPSVTTNSCLDAPVSEGEHPVVVFTHGYTGTFTDYTYIFEDLASRGYIVASVDHTYEATAIAFPDGRFLHSGFGSHLGNTLIEDEQALALALTVRLDDLKFVAGELERLNGVFNGAFAGKLDINKIALAGHSMGGLAASLGVQRDRRFKAGVILDVHDGEVPDAAIKTTAAPVLILASGRQQWTKNECKLWSSLRGPRFAVNLEGAEHLTTSDAVWLANGAIKTGTMGAEKAIAAVRQYIATFLDANLQNKAAEPLLAGPSLDYPDAAVTTQTQSLCSEAEKEK
jgi:predicted dienelactone hydrolase